MTGAYNPGEGFRALIDTLDEAIAVFERVAGEPRDWRFLATNAAYRALFGRDDFVGRTVRAMFPQADEEWFELMDGVAASGRARRFIREMRSEPRTLEVFLAPFGSGAGGMAHLLTTLRDITAFAAARRALEDSEERLRLATEAAEIGFWDVDEINHVLIWPRLVKQLFGVPPEAPVSMADFYAGLHPEDRERVSAAYAAAADPQTRALYDVEYRTVGRTDGVIRWVAAKGRGVFDERGRCLRVIGVAVDVTPRKYAEARVRELNESLERRVAEALAEKRRLAEVIDRTDLFVLVADTDYNWLAINEAAANEFARVFGVPKPKAGDNMLAALDHLPEQRAAVRAAWARALGGEDFVDIQAFGAEPGARRFYEMRFRALREADGRVSGAYQFVADVTERLRDEARLAEAEAALRQAQKMEAVGQLTGGVAHDFNNLLQGVAGSFDLIRRKPDDPARVLRWAEAGLQAAERGAKLTSQLLAFSRSQKLEARPIDPSALIANMRDLLERTLGPAIRISYEIDTACPAVLADATQLELALLNLAINARDAMPNGGRLAIAAQPRRIAGDPELGSGDYVEIAVADSGGGMAPEVAARAFEPFFTTKEIGKGTGLGLAQVYAIARQAGGVARIESAPGRGATVRLILPRTQSTAAPGGPTAPEAATTGTSAAVLVIDDDPDVRRFLADALEQLGYAAVITEDGRSGLAALERERPDLMLLDYAMPGLNGAEVLRAARRSRPDLPVVLTSGYADHAAIAEAGGEATAILRKPFRVGQLREALAAALSGRR